MLQCSEKRHTSLGNRMEGFCFKKVALLRGARDNILGREDHPIRL